MLTDLTSVAWMKRAMLSARCVPAIGPAGESRSPGGPGRVAGVPPPARMFDAAAYGSLIASLATAAVSG